MIGSLLGDALIRAAWVPAVFVKEDSHLRGLDRVVLLAKAQEIGVLGLVRLDRRAPGSIGRRQCSQTW
jgi:hypothetical protein